MTVSAMTQAVAGVAGIVPCTADFQRFPCVLTLKHPAIRLFVAERFAQGAHLIFLAAHDGIMLIRHDGERWGYEVAAARIQDAAPVLGYAILELCNHNLREGHAYAAAIWAAGLAFGTDGE